MKTTLSLVSILILSACGGNPEVKHVTQNLSSSVAIPCNQSKECQQRVANNEVILSCTEKFVGYQVVSSWDNGVSWLNGNCDMTHPDLQKD
jgi:hypothetical protein